MLTTEIENHAAQKRYLQPAFYKSEIDKYGLIMGTLARKLSAEWEEKKNVDVADEMNRLALDVVVQTLLGSELSANEKQEIVDSIQVIKELTDHRKTPFIDQLLWKLPLPSNTRYTKAHECLDQKIYDLIRIKREGTPLQNDVVTTLLKAQASGESQCPYQSNKLVRDEVMTMFLTGHETVASSMTWMWFVLNNYPDIEQKIYEELDVVVGARAVEPEDVPNLEYLRKVFLETMRLYPPVWVIVRHPQADTQLGKYVIPAGAHISLCQYIVHRDPRYFPDPEKFDPERWTPEGVALRPKFSYFPFGGGKRKCIGEAFAMIEGMIVIATLAQKWQLRRTGSEPIEMEPLVTLRPKNGMKMQLTKRLSEVRYESLV